MTSTHPMPGSAADVQRAKLTPALRGACEAIDRAIARTFPDTTSEANEIWRDGRVVGLRQAIDAICAECGK